MIFNRTIARRCLIKIQNCFSETSQSEEKLSNQSVIKKMQQQKIKKHGTHLGKILIHIESDQFRNRFELKKYVHTHAWSCVHMWMIDYRSRFLNCSWGESPTGFILRPELKLRIQKYNYDQIDNYSDRKEREIYYQLNRIKNVLYFALDDYFVYNFQGKTMRQIISQDMGLYSKEEDWKDSSQATILNIQQYITRKISQLKTCSLSEIRRGNFLWTL